MLTFSSCKQSDIQPEVSTTEMTTYTPVESTSPTYSTGTAYATSTIFSTTTHSTSMNKPLNRKIGIATNATDNLSYLAASKIANKTYAIINEKWPEGYRSGQEHYINTIRLFCEVEDVDVIVLQDVNPYLGMALTKVKEILDPKFVIFICDPYSDPMEMLKYADIVLQTDKLGMGISMSHQAKKMGAKTFVIYTNPEGLTEDKTLDKQCDLLGEECRKIGLEFVKVALPNPLTIAGIAATKQFVLKDIPEQVDLYGKDTAFFSPFSGVQDEILISVIEEGAIFPLSCHPSPYIGFRNALGLEYNDYNPPAAEIVVSQIKEALTEKQVPGRISTWPVDPDVMFVEGAYEYALKYINGDVPKEGIDIDVLTQLMTEYAGVHVYLTPYTDDYPYSDNGTGETYENVLMMQMDYITFD